MIVVFPAKADPGMVLTMRGDDGDYILNDRGHVCGPQSCDHASDCAVHNMPALPAGDCDCGFDAGAH